MLRRIAGSSLIVLSFLAAGCGTARYVQREQGGGTIALEGDHQKAMEEAQRLMVAHCQGPYSIVSEGETVVGSQTSHEDQSYVTKDGRVVNRGGETTHQATEWRINYQCGGAPPGPGPGPGTFITPPPGPGQPPYPPPPQR